MSKGSAATPQLPCPAPPAPIPSPTSLPDPCPHGLANPAWCDLCRQGIGRLVVNVLLGKGESDEVYRRLAELVCSPGVAAWQVDRLLV